MLSWQRSTRSGGTQERSATDQTSSVEVRSCCVGVSVVCGVWCVACGVCAAAVSGQHEGGKYGSGEGEREKGSRGAEEIGKTGRGV